MLLRATVVLLVILNFGVAVWWAVRGAPGDAAALVDTGPSTLRLVGEPAGDGAATPAPVTPAFVESDTTAVPAGTEEDVPVETALRAADPAQCVALGPFADVPSRDAALAQLSPVAVTVPRAMSAKPRAAGASGWRRCPIARRPMRWSRACSRPVSTTTT